MKKIIESIIRLRNPKFCFDFNLDTRSIITFMLMSSLKMIRNLKILCFLRMPKFMLLGPACRLRYIHKITWGKFLKLGQNVHLSALGTKGIIIGNNVSIGSYSHLIVSTTLNNIGKYIQIEDNVGIGEYSYIGGAGGVLIGKNTIVGQYLSIHPENHKYQNTDILIKNQGVSRQGVTVGENCWLGSKVTILDGVSIGANSVIAAGAVVTRSFPAYSVIGGVPAKLIKSRKATLKVS